MRQAFEDAKVYKQDWDDYDAKIKKGDKDVRAPHRDLKLEALADILRGKLLVQIHCYRADEFLTEEAIAKEYGYKIRAFHHALEMYKVGAKIAADDTAIATFADWWGFKDEAWDAIPWNAVMSMREGVKVALKSDSNDHVRRLNQEAGKMVHYGGATEDEAIQMITLNAAWIMGVDDKVGSLDVGKDGDVVIWNTDPLSTYARAEKVYIDGDLYFDSSLSGLGTTHFTGVMHGGGFTGSDDETGNDEGGN
jgi:imidazolonepropionase-like amidohydrolase